MRSHRTASRRRRGSRTPLTLAPAVVFALVVLVVPTVAGSVWPGVVVGLVVTAPLVVAARRRRRHTDDDTGVS